MSAFKNVLITGASSGLGRSLALEFASRGHGVALVARRADLLESLKSEIAGKHGTPVSVHAADVSSIEAMRVVAGEVERKLGRTPVSE